MRGQKSNTKAGMPRGYYAGRPQMAEPGRYHADRADGHLAKKIRRQSSHKGRTNVG